jgi:hypothetical protein
VKCIKNHCFQIEFGSWKRWSTEGKFHSILSENPGYEQIREIEEILAAKRTELPSKKLLTVEQIAAFVYVPWSFCDVKRSFSRYENILPDNSRRLAMENVEHLVLVIVNHNRWEGERLES